MEGLENQEPKEAMSFEEMNGQEIPDSVQPNAEGAEGEKPNGDGAEGDVVDEKVKWLNELTGSEFKSVDEVKSSDLPSRLKANEELATSYNSTKAELEEARKKADEYKAQINPRSHFVSDNEYIRQQMLQKHPNLDSGVLSNIVTSDLDKMSPIEILKMDMKIQYPGLKSKDSALVELIEKKFNISADSLDIEDGSTESLEVQMAVQDALKKFEGLKEGIELPDMEKIEANKLEKINSLSNEWKPFVESLPNKLDKVVIETKDNKGNIVPLLEYEIDDKFREAMKSKVDAIVKSQAERGVEFSQERQDALVNSWKQYYIGANLPSIIEHRVSEVVSNMTQQQFEKYHNPSPRPGGESPSDGSPVDESMASIEADIMGR